MTLIPWASGEQFFEKSLNYVVRILALGFITNLYNII